MNFINQLLENLRKEYSSFKDNIWGADLADMQLLSKFNKGFRFLLCVIDIFSKYAWVIPLKDKKGISIVNAFQKLLKESDGRPNKIWVEKGSDFYSNLKNWLQDNDIQCIQQIMKENQLLLKEQQIRINYIEEISIKSDAKR